MRRYRLEPADEYGDAALNEYRYVGFLWGSAQLAAATAADGPAAVIADDRGGGGLFAKCVAAAYRRAAERARELGRPRPAPVWRHSYQLWNLSACARWRRVNGCLMAAFRAQVLGRFRVVRHLAFGELLRFGPDPRPPVVSFYDCIPAAAASKAAMAAMAAKATETGDCGEGGEDCGGEDCGDGEGGRTDSERRPADGSSPPPPSLSRPGVERVVKNYLFE